MHRFKKNPRGHSVIKIIATVAIVILTVATVGGVAGGLLLSCSLGLICGGGGSSGGGGGGGGGSQQVQAGASCGSTANACGQTNLGTIVNIGGGQGQCNASPPPNSSCPQPTISPDRGFYANPSTVGPNGQTTLYWSSANTTACDITGDNGFTASGSGSGNASTGTLNQTTTFTLSCRDGDGGPTASKSIRVIIDPHYQEI